MTARTERYSHGHHESVLRSHSWRTVDNSAAYLKARLVPGMSVLDVGCGPGTITAEIADLVTPGRVVGLDAAPGIIEQASVLAETRPGLSFVTGDAYALPFDGDEFDLVHAHQTLQHLADPVAALREFARVTKRGGIVAARDVDYAAVAIHPMSTGLEAWAALYQAVHRSNGGEPDAGRRMKAWALGSGFTDVVTTASVWCFESDADREWWGGMWAVRVLESTFAEDAVSSGLASRDELQDISDAWSAWSRRPDATLIMPHGEIVCRV